VSAICPICHGTGNLLTFRRGMEYWPCPRCHGDAVTVVFGPAIMQRHRNKTRTPRP